MGVDESGKGDFFGPLVVVAAYVDKPLVKALQNMGVKDSKNITSDAKALGLGADIRKLLGKRFAVVKIGARAYNRLYAKMRNVNTLLAWAHARAIENLLDAVPDCPRAVSDQFGKKEQVERALMKKGRRIQLIQRHKAESDMAVAAASVVARELFLRGLKDLGEKHKQEIPKGASDIVRSIAIEIARKEGADVLLEAVKCHFKTTDAVLTELKLDRSALGPDGQAISKAVTPRKKKKPASD
jgi:ribonuclease HIII